MVGKIGEWVTEHLAEHPGILIGALVILIIVLVISGSLSSCSAMMGGVQNVTVATSFTADDDQILAVEADYVEKEENLQDRIDNIESDYPGYDEYNYSLVIILMSLPHYLPCCMRTIQNRKYKACCRPYLIISTH